MLERSAAAARMTAGDEGLSRVAAVQIRRRATVVRHRRAGPQARALKERPAGRAALPLRWMRTAASARAGLRIAQKMPTVMRPISSRLDMNNCARKAK